MEVQLLGNALALLWVAVSAGIAVKEHRHRRRRGNHDGTGLVIWGSFLIALLALNIHDSPFRTLTPPLQYVGIVVAAAALVARAWLGVRDRGETPGRFRRAHYSRVAFSIGLAAASGNGIALVTVLVSVGGATAVAFAAMPERPWELPSRTGRG